MNNAHKPTPAFIGASWAALLVGTFAFLIGLYNATMPFIEKSFYFTVLMFGLFASASLQKAVRDRMEGVPVTSIYYGLSWSALSMSILMLVIGLWNADLARSEKGSTVWRSCWLCLQEWRYRRTSATLPCSTIQRLSKTRSPSVSKNRPKHRG